MLHQGIFFSFLQVPLGALYVREYVRDDFEETSERSGIQEFVEVVVKGGLTDISKLHYQVKAYYLMKYMC